METTAAGGVGDSGGGRRDIIVGGGALNDAAIGGGLLNVVGSLTIGFIGGGTLKVLFVGGAKTSITEVVVQGLL